MAADIVAVLYPTYPKTSRAKVWANVPSEWKGMHKVHTHGTTQMMVTLFEPGLYHLITRSKSPLEGAGISGNPLEISLSDCVGSCRAMEGETIYIFFGEASRVSRVDIYFVCHP